MKVMDLIIDEELQTALDEFNRCLEAINERGDDFDHAANNQLLCGLKSQIAHIVAAHYRCQQKQG